jgi:transketolase
MLLNKDLRKEIAWMTWHSKEGHIPSAYSIVDIVDFLFTDFLKINIKNANTVDRDSFVLSKGHGCSALYSVFKKIGLLKKSHLLNKNKEFSILATHPDRTKIKAVDTSTGSLGNGIGFAVGLALANKIKKNNFKTVTLIGDGESNEGLVWECALLAAHRMLGNLCVVLDNNKSCEPTLSIPNALEKWRSFGWEATEINGHDISDIQNVFRRMNFKTESKPKIIIAHTVKGKGVKPMEENYGHWHSRVPNNEELKMIYEEIDNYKQ